MRETLILIFLNEKRSLIPQGFGARLFVSALVKKIFECQVSFVVGDNCI